LVGLANDGKLRVVAAVIALPVRVVGNIARRESDGVGVFEGIVGAGGRVAVVWVEGDTVGAVGVNCKGASDAFPDAGRLKRVLLKQLLAPIEYIYCRSIRSGSLGSVWEGMTFRSKRSAWSRGLAGACHRRLEVNYLCYAHGGIRGLHHR
jgi:hypothetical protein